MGDQIGEAAVRRRRVRVVLYREAEVADRRLARLLDHIFACAHRLHDCQRQIGKAKRIGFVAADEEVFERVRIRVGRQVVAEVRGDFLDAVPAFGRAHHAPQAGEIL